MGLPKNSIVPVAGVSFEKDNVKKVKVGAPVRLVPEPDNEYDSNAVAVFVDNVGKVGYVPKVLAKRLTGQRTPVPFTFWEGTVEQCLTHKGEDGNDEQVGLRIRLAGEQH